MFVADIHARTRRQWFCLEESGPREHRGWDACPVRPWNDVFSRAAALALPSCTGRPAQEKRIHRSHTPVPIYLTFQDVFPASGSSEFVELVFLHCKLNRIIFFLKNIRSIYFSKLHRNLCIKPHIRQQESGSAACNRIKFACTEHSYHVFHWARDDAIKIKLTLAFSQPCHSLWWAWGRSDTCAWVAAKDTQETCDFLHVANIFRLNR